MCSSITRWFESEYLQFLSTNIQTVEKKLLRDISPDGYFLSHIRKHFFSPLTNKRFPSTEYYDWCNVFENTLSDIYLKHNKVSVYGLLYVSSIFLICDFRRPYTVRIAGLATMLVVSRMMEDESVASEAWYQYKRFLGFLLEEGLELNGVALTEDQRECRFFHLFSWLFMCVVEGVDKTDDFSKRCETLSEWSRVHLHISDDVSCLIRWQELVDTGICDETMKVLFHRCLQGKKQDGSAL